MTLKRKRSVDQWPLSTSPASASPTTPSPTPQHARFFDATGALAADPRPAVPPRERLTSSDLGTRTRKRLRDGRPDESVIHGTSAGVGQRSHESLTECLPQRTRCTSSLPRSAASRSSSVAASETRPLEAPTEARPTTRMASTRRRRTRRRRRRCTPSGICPRRPRRLPAVPSRVLRRTWTSARRRPGRGGGGGDAVLASQSGVIHR